MTIAQTKAARRKMKNDPRFNKARKSATARADRIARDKRNAVKAGKSHGYKAK